MTMSKLSNYRANFAVPSTMQALVLSGMGFDNVAVREVPVPQPGPNQLLARVDAAGVCTSILKIMDQGPNHTYFNGWDPAKWPVILGDEGSVTIVKAGANLGGQYKVGQRFAIQPGVDLPPINHRERYRDNATGMLKCALGYTLDGALAQYALIPEEILQGQCLLPLPSPDMPYFAVSMGEPVSCVVCAQDRQIHLLQKGPVSPRTAHMGMLPGGTTVVIGVGPMGLMHAELSLRFRPKNLIVCDKIAERLARARKVLSAKAQKAGVNLITLDADQLKATLAQVTNGRMADDMVLAVGINPVQQAAIELLGRGGVANLFGGLPKGKHMLQLDALRVHYDEIKLVGSSGGSPLDLALALKAFADGDLDPGNYVFGVGGLQHAVDVLRGIKEGKIEGKVILYPHAKVDTLTLGLEHWSGDEERDFLEARLTT